MRRERGPSRELIIQTSYGTNHDFSFAKSLKIMSKHGLKEKLLASPLLKVGGKVSVVLAFLLKDSTDLS